MIENLSLLTFLDKRWIHKENLCYFIKVSENISDSNHMVWVRPDVIMWRGERDKPLLPLYSPLSLHFPLYDFSILVFSLWCYLMNKQSAGVSFGLGWNVISWLLDQLLSCAGRTLLVVSIFSARSKARGRYLLRVYHRNASARWRVVNCLKRKRFILNKRNINRITKSESCQ